VNVRENLTSLKPTRSRKRAVEADRPLTSGPKSAQEFRPKA